MKTEKKNEISSSIKNFHLPRYNEIPDVGLYLEQTTKYINGFLAPLHGMEVTTSMISNYVKKGLISSPVKKQYSAEQIAYLIYIAVIKLVASMENISLMLEMQKSTYSMPVAYDYFCCELENILANVFGLKNTVDNIGTTESDEKFMLRNAIIAVAHKLYLDKYCETVQQDKLDT